MALTAQQKVGLTAQQEMDLLKLLAERKNRVEITTLPRVEDIRTGQHMWFGGKWEIIF